MTGQMHWFRLHHDYLEDGKLMLAARRSGEILAHVAAVWIHLQVLASKNTERGTLPLDIDHEAIDCLFGLNDGSAARIIDALASCGLISKGRVSDWERRQPKREDETAADRKRRQRERAHELRLAAIVNPDPPSNVTQRHAAVTHGHDRGEERREEIYIRPQELALEPSGASETLPPPRVPVCPVDDVIALYHEVLPSLPRCRLTSKSRHKAIEKRWRWVLTSRRDDGSLRASSKSEALDWFRRFFDRARLNGWLMGNTPRAAAHANWRCDLDFLLTDKGLKAVIEHTEEAHA